MAWYNPADWLSDAASGANMGGAAQGVQQGVKSAAAWGGKKNFPTIGPNPYQGGFDSLIGQLQQQASGQGPSLAENAYKQAHAQGLQDQQSMAAGGSAGRARQAGLNTSRLTQGLAAGSSNARLQEQMAAQQSLQQALSGAGQMWFQPQMANMQSQMGAKANWEKLLGAIGMGAQAYGTVAGGKPPTS